MAPRAPLACWLLVCSLCALTGTGCEAIADFDPKKLEQDRTVGPVPLPSLDGGLTGVRDAASPQDGALIRPEPADAQVDAAPAQDAGELDATLPPDDAAADAAAEPPDARTDSGNDAPASSDIALPT